jgi:SAM-dependent methyltransferase
MFDEEERDARMSDTLDAGRSVASRCNEMATEYDRSKDAQGWRGPEVVFGLMYAFVHAGESVLDIGIGTGLGSHLFHKAGLRVHGMDISPRMLEVCAKKKIAEELKLHDLTVEPYPYSAASLDHAICVGVLNHFEDPGPVFREVSRILGDDAVFGFVVADRNPGEGPSFDVEHADSRATMFRHGRDRIGSLLDEAGFEFLRELEFSVAGHRDSNRRMRLKAYVAGRKRRLHNVESPATSRKEGE